MSARGFRGTVALALGLLMSTIPCMGVGARRNTNPIPASPAARVATHATSLSSASPLRSGALASGELHLVGLRLVAPGSRIDVPQDAPFTVPVALYLGNRVATAAEISQMVPSGARLVGTLSGPSVSTQTLTGVLSSGLNIPGLSGAGDYTLSDIRLMNGSTTILQAEPATVAIRCLGEVIITSAIVAPLTMDEIRAAGIQLGQGNYEGKRFTLGLSVGGQTVNLNLAVAIPTYNGLENPNSENPLVRLELDAKDAHLAGDLSVSVVDILPDTALTLARPEVAHILQHSFKGLVVIPGSIGYLHQFFKVNLLVLNVLPDGSPYILNNLHAVVSLPTGKDGITGTADDPIRIVASQGETADPTKAILGPGTSGQPGSGGPILHGSETGSAVWFMEGVKEGSHRLDFRITGEFSGGALAGPIPITGMARGQVLVRNPRFSLVLVHPDVIAKNEEYTLEARLTNTSQSIANLVSITLDQARLAGVKLVGDASQTIDTLNPGDTASFKFRLKAKRSGEVLSSYLYIEEGSIGFQLTTGLGERQIGLNPDTLVLPQTLDGVPEALREAMLRVLSQAHSIATTKTALPSGVLPIRSTTISGPMTTGLNEAGLFLKMGVDRERVWNNLWRLFTQNSDTGFDQLMRTTDAGQALRDAFTLALQGWASGPALEQLPVPLAQQGPLDSVPLLAGLEGAGEGLTMGASIPGVGDVTAGTTDRILTLPGAASMASATGRFVQALIPNSGALVWMRNDAMVARDLSLQTVAPLLNQAGKTSINTYHLRLYPGGIFQLPLGLDRGPQATFTQPGQPDQTLLPSATSDLSPEPFQVLAVHRYDLEVDPGATPFGTHVMVLFNRAAKLPTLPEGEANWYPIASSLVKVDANQLWVKAMPPSSTGDANPAPVSLSLLTPSIVSLYLEKPVGPNIIRNLSLTGAWQAQSGESLQGNPVWPIRSGQIPGGAIVKGKLRKATGEAMPGLLKYWYIVSPNEGGVDLLDGQAYEDPYYGLITNNVATASDGTFQLDYVPEPAKTAIGPFRLQGVSGDRMATGDAAVLGAGGTLILDLVLEGRGTVQGRVLEGSGLPIAGATVQIIREQPSYDKAPSTQLPSSQVTGGDGAYQFPNISTGIFSLRVRKGLLGAALSGEIPQDGSVVVRDVVLKAAVGSLVVTVNNTGGTPRPNQVVLLGIPAGLLRTGETPTFITADIQPTDGNGRVTFQNVPSGDVNVSLPFTGSRAEAWFGQLAPGETKSITLNLRDPQSLATVHIHVQDSAGQPVYQASLFWQQANGAYPSAHTDAIGDSVLPAPPNQPYSVAVKHPDWPPSGVQSGTVTPLPGSSVNLTVVMPPRAAIAGHVTYQDGQPVVGAYVAVPPVYGAMRFNRMAITDPNGAYRIAGLSVDHAERLSAVGPELMTSVNVSIQGAPEQTQAVNLTLPKPGQNVLQGTVYQPSEGTERIPVMGANLEFTGQLPSVTATGSGDDSSGWGNSSWGLPQEVFLGGAISGTDGTYRKDAIPVGGYKIQAWSDLFPPHVYLQGVFTGSTETRVQDITLIGAFSGALEGQVYLPNGQTKAGAGLHVRLGHMGQNPTTHLVEFQELLSVDTSANGRYAFPAVIQPGYYILRTEDPNTGAISADEVYVPRQANLLRDVRLWGKGNLTVKVQDSLGQPLQDAVITLSHANAGHMETNDLPPRSERILPSSQGQFTYSDVWEGPVRVDLKNPQGLAGVGSLLMPQGGGDAQLIVQLQPTGKLRGMLRRADGTPVPAGRVDAYRAGAWIGISTTQQDGIPGLFKMEGLPSGAVQLEAWDPDTRQIGHASVTVPDNAEVVVDITTLDMGSVTVRVAKEGLPMGRATVSIAYAGGPASGFSTQATTDDLGLASFILPPGHYNVAATDPISLATGRAAFDRANDQGAISVDVALTPTRSWQVKALPPKDWNGALTGWKAQTNTGRTLSLDAGGTATFDSLAAGTYGLTLIDGLGRYRGSRTAVLTVEGGALQSVEVQALARGSVDALLLDAHGLPVSSGRVSLRWVPGEQPGATLFTDTQGHVNFPGVLEGTRYLDGQSTDGLQSVLGDTALAGEGATATLTLTLAPTAGFAGVLKNATGSPVAFTSVTFWPERYLPPVTTLATDALGNFQAHRLPVGNYHVEAHVGSSRVAVRQVRLITADATENADLTLTAGGTIKGILTDPLRSSIGGVQVWLQDGSSNLPGMTVDSQGHFEFPDVPVGHALNLWAVMDDGLTPALNVPVMLDSEGQVKALTQELEPRPNLKGRTFESDGATHRSMTLVVYTNPPGTWGQPVRAAATSIDHPTFLLNYLTPGTNYYFYGYDNNHLVATATAQVASSPVLQTQDVYAFPLRDVGFQLRYPDGSALAATGHAVLTFDLNGPDRYETSVGADGTAHFLGIATGPYHVSISGVANQPVLTRALAVVEGTGEEIVNVPAQGIGSLAVTVKTTSGRTLTGGSITASAPGSPMWTAVYRAADQSYGLDGIWAGVPLSLHASGFGTLGAAPAAQISAHGATATVIWAAPDQGRVHGIIRDHKGQPLSGALVKVDGIQGSTDVSGAYGLDSIPVGPRTLTAWMASDPRWVSVSVNLGQDSQDFSQDLALPGLGTVNVRTLDRSGNALGNQALTLSTLGHNDASRSATTDASGNASFAGVMAGAVSANATLEGRAVNVSGTLVADASLSLDLKARDATVVQGRIQRADSAQSWPVGTKAIVRGVEVPMGADGTLHPVGGVLDFEYSDQPIPVDLQVPGAPKLHMADLPMVKDGITQVDLKAPALGNLNVTVTKKDGSPAAGAKLTSTNLPDVTADSTGKAMFMAFAGSYTLYAVLDGDAGHAAATVANDGETLSVPIALGEVLDVSGVYSATDGEMVLFQDGTALSGPWGAYARNAFQGTLQGTLVTGTWTNPTSGTHGGLKIQFSPDGMSFSGTYGYEDKDDTNPFSGTRTPGVRIKLVSVSRATLAVNGILPLKALVAGTPDKSVTWMANAGSVTADGIYTAPATPAFATVAAASVADPTQVAVARISATADGKLDVSGGFGPTGGDFLVYQEGDLVRIRGYGLRQFEGTLVDRHLSGSWTDPDSIPQGHFAFVFEEDGGAFSGSYGLGNSSTGTAANAIRQPGIVGIFTWPRDLRIRMGATMPLKAYVVGNTNTTMLWAIDQGYGNITPGGIFTAPNLSGVTTVHVASLADPTRTDSSQIQFVPPIVLTPGNSTLPVGLTQAFTAQLTGFTNNAITWSASGGSIDPTGLYTAPQVAGTCTITATSVEDPTWNGTATVNVRPFVAVTPASANLYIGDHKTFAVTLTGLSGGVTWFCTAGTIDASGTYTAPTTAGTYTVTATSTADPTKSGSARVDVTSRGLGTLRVSIQTEAGRRLSGTSVIAQAYGSPTWPGVLQGDGTYLIEGVWSGETIVLQATGFGVLNYPPSIQGPANGTTLDVIWTAPNQGVVHGIVKDYRSQPLSGAVVTLLYGVGPSTTTDATGAYALAGVPVGSWTLKATVPGQVIWDQQSIYLAQDQESKTLDFTLPGTGTVVVHALDRTGATPLPAQSVTLFTQGNGDYNRTLATDAQGLARFEGLMAGTVSGSAVLEGRSVSVSGTLTAEAVLDLNLKALDATTVRGRITRTIIANAWPTGTKARIQGVDVPMASDGTLQPVGGRLDFLYATTPISVDVLVPGAVTKHLADLPMVKNGETVVDIAAPALATLDIAVTKKDGSAAAGADLGGPGLVAATADATGKAQMLAWAPAVTLSGVVGSQFNHQDITITTDGAAVPVAMQLGEGLDVSGVFATNYYINSYYGWANLVLFQDGTRITGTLEGHPAWVIDATLDGNTVAGTWADMTAPVTTHGRLRITFAADLASFTGSYGYGDSYTGYSFTGTRQAGEIRVMVVPAAATLAVNGAKSFKALVAGTSTKTVTWDATGGSVDSLGLFTAPADAGFATVFASSTESAYPRGAARVCVTPDGQLDLSGVFGHLSGGYWGYWIDDWILHQSGNTVTGHWSSRNAHISGTLNGRVVSGTWKDLSGAYDGRIELTLDEDGGFLTGVWGYGANSPTNSVYGTRTPGRVGIFARPAYQKVRAGSATTLTSYVVGTQNTAVNWSSYPGTITPGGVFTAPSNPALCNLVVAPQADPYSTYTFTLEAVPPVTVAPATLTLPVGGIQAFTSSLTGFTSSAVTWSCTGGSITAEGLFTAPTAPGVVTVTATSVEEPSLQGTTTVSVRAYVEVSPVLAVLGINSTQQFTYQVTGLYGGVTWSCTAGTIDGYGMYTAPATAGTRTITATSGYDPTKSASATVTVRSANVRIAPGSATLYTSETQTFAATVEGLTDQTVTWSVQGGGSIDSVGVFTAPATAGTCVVKATSVKDPSVFSTVSVEVLGINILTVELRTADGRPVVNRPFQLSWDGSTSLLGKTDADAKFTLRNLPLGKILTLSDMGPILPSGQQRDPFWYPLLQNRSVTFAQSGESQGLSLILPVGKLDLQFRRGSVAIPGVRNVLALAGHACPWMTFQNSSDDASGNWSLLDVPLNMNMALIADRAYVIVYQSLLLDQPEKTITVEWPPVAGKQTVKVLRASGASIANPAALGDLGFYASPGNDDGSPAPDQGTGAERVWSLMIPGFKQTVSVQLDVSTPFYYRDCGEMSGPYNLQLRMETNFTPGPTPEIHETRMPVLAALHLTFQDKNGTALPESLPGDHLILSIGDGCPAKFTVPSLGNCVLPQMFLEGPQVIHLRSDRWGALPDITFTVAPSDDGKTLEQIVKLPWIKTNFELKVQAGDHVTPVPGAVVSLTTLGQTVELARVPEGMKDTDTVKASYFGHEATDLKLEASFTPRRQTVAVTDHLDNQPTGGTLQATFTLPLTVLRTHLKETNDTELEGQGLDAKAPSDKGDADPEPTASIGGKNYGLVLGEAAGSVIDLQMYDPASGLGVLKSATVPALGTYLDVSGNLAPHAWLTSATLTSAPTAPYLLVAIGRDAPEMVKPEAASWLQGPAGLGPLKVPVFMNADGLGAELSWIRPASEIPDPANPPQPVLAWRPKVRIPLSASIWATAWTLWADDQGNGTFHLWPELNPYGKGSLIATENQELTASADPLTWVWNTSFFMQGMDASNQPLSYQPIQAWPLAAPGSWQFYGAYSNDQGLWTLSLPVDQPLHAQTAPSGCGAGTWLFGALDFTAADPAPATPPVLHATEVRDLPPCPPTPPAAKAVNAKKPGARKPVQILATNTRKGGRK